MSEELFAPDTVKFEDLVGPDKKFKTNDDVAKKVVHADQHITNLEKELSELRGELQTRLSVEEMLAKLQKPASASAPNNDQRNGGEQRQEPGSQIDLAEEVRKLVSQERNKEKAEANLNSVRNELKSRFGPDYNQKLTSIAQELGISKEFLTDMAKTSPAGFIKLVDSVAKPDKERTVVPPQGSNAAFQQPNAGVKNNAYYQQLRREKPDVYFSRKVQMEIHNEAMRQGADFYK